MVEQKLNYEPDEYGCVERFSDGRVECTSCSRVIPKGEPMDFHILALEYYCKGCSLKIREILDKMFPVNQEVSLPSSEFFLGLR